MRTPAGRRYGVVTVVLLVVAGLAGCGAVDKGEERYAFTGSGGEVTAGPETFTMSGDYVVTLTVSDNVTESEVDGDFYVTIEAAHQEMPFYDFFDVENFREGEKTMSVDDVITSTYRLGVRCGYKAQWTLSFERTPQ